MSGHYVCETAVCSCVGGDDDLYSCDCRALELTGNELSPWKTCLDCGALMKRVCINCGCSDFRACVGGCAWSPDPDYCTTCYRPEA